MDKNYSNDNYNWYSDTMIITTTFAHSVAILIYLPLAPLSMVVPALPKPAGVP